jgi:hypothetical protein
MTTKQADTKGNTTGPTLDFHKPEADAHINILLYGPPKSGKTVGASSAPGPILYLNADRGNATRFAHKLHGDRMNEAHVTGLDTLVAALAEIKRGDYATVVLDPIGEIYRAVLEGLSGRAMRPKIQDYGDTGTHVERFVRALCDEPINLVIIAHETAVRDEDTGSFERLPYTGTNNPAFAAKLMALVDVIGYTGVVEGEGDAPSRYMAQLITAHGRRGGDRFGVLGTARELDLSEWIKLAQQAIKQ